MRPRLESSMPLDAAQARTALRSSADDAFGRVVRVPTLRACCTQVSSELRTAEAFIPENGSLLRKLLS